jgi:hypothetical protein
VNRGASEAAGVVVGVKTVNDVFGADGDRNTPGGGACILVDAGAAAPLLNTSTYRLPALRPPAPYTIGGVLAGGAPAGGAAWLGAGDAIEEYGECDVLGGAYADDVAPAPNGDDIPIGYWCAEQPCTLS